MGLILTILVIVGIVWALKSTSVEPEDSRANLLLQIIQIQKRVTVLENEVKLLKGSTEPLHSQPQPEPEEKPYIIEKLLEEKQPIEPEYSDTSTKEEYTDEPDEEYIEKFEGVFSKISDDQFKEEKPKEEFEEVLYKAFTSKDLETEKEHKTIELESYLTSNLFNKIGAVALILGVGFFLKYAFDNNLFNPVIQIFLSFLFSGGLIFGASHFFKQDKYKIFAQGIAGAGIGIAYLTIYSAYSSYQLFSYPVACAFMLITAIVAFLQSLKYDSIATAILALIGGFVTPFILSGGNTNFLGLLTYLVFLNALVVSLIYKKDSWKILGIMSSVVTYLSYFALHMNSYNSPNALGSMLFLTLIWALYFGFDIVKIKASEYNYDFLNIENGTLFYLCVYNLYANDINALVFATFSIALTYLFSGIAVHFKHNGLDIYLKQNFYAFAALFAIATNFATAGFTKPLLFAVEAFMFLYFGTHLEKAYIQKISASFFTLSYLTLLCNPQVYSFASASDYIPIFNFRDLTFIALIGLTILSVKVFEKANNNEELTGYISFYRFSWSSLLFILLSVEINDVMLKIASSAATQASTDLINFNKSMVHVIVWALYSIKLLSTGIKQNLKAFTIVGFTGTIIALVHLGISGISYGPIESFIPLINLRCIAFVVMASCLIYLSNLLKENKDKYEWANSVIGSVSYIWCTILFVLFSLEINDTASRIALSSSEWLQPIVTGEGMLQTIAWITYSVTLLNIGFKKNIEQILHFSLVGIGISIAYLFWQESLFTNLEYFMPILNFRFFAFVITATCLIFANKVIKQNEENFPWCKGIQGMLTYVWCTILFVLLGVEISDTALMISNKSYNVLQPIFYGKGMLQTIAWGLYSVILLNIGFKKNINQIIYFGLVGIGISTAYLFIQEPSFASSHDFMPILNLRLLAFVTTAGCLIFTNKLLKQNEERYAWCKELYGPLSYIWGIILFLLLNFEISDYFKKYDYTTSDVSNIKQLVISLGWLIYSVIAMYFGILKRIKPLRKIALIVLGLTILKVFIFDLSFLDQLGRIIAFMGLGVILLLLSFFYQKYSEQIKKLIHEDITIEN